MMDPIQISPTDKEMLRAKRDRAKQAHTEAAAEAARRLRDATVTEHQRRIGARLDAQAAQGISLATYERIPGGDEVLNALVARLRAENWTVAAFHPGDPGYEVGDDGDDNETPYITVEE